jgi:hypothetical protein
MMFALAPSRRGFVGWGLSEHVVDVLSGGDELEKGRSGKTLLRVKITAEDVAISTASGLALLKLYYYHC